MKSIVLTLLAVSTLVFSATAQEKREMKPGHKQSMMQHRHHGMMMAAALNFTDAQKAQAKLNHEALRQKMQELNKNENITVKEMRDRKEALRKEQKAKMGALLTPEQKTKMTQLKAEQKIKREAHFAKHLDKMKTALGLTDTQVSLLKSQHLARQAKLKAIKENESLTREQRKEQLMSLKGQAKDQHRKILTPEQQQKMEEMKKKRFDKSAP